VCALLFLIGIQTATTQNIDLDKVKSEEFFRWGVEAFHNGFFNNAILSFEKALSFHAENHRARIWLGRAFYKSGYEEQALHEWNHLVRNGQATGLLKNWINFVSYRRSAAEEVAGQRRFVVSSEIDGNRDTSYPFKRPTSVHPRDDGSFYVVAFASNEILHIDANSRIMSIMGGGMEGFDHPYDVLEVDGQFLLVTEFSGNRITKCRLSGEKILSFGKRGVGPGELLGPQYLARDEFGYIYVSDYGNRRVSKFDYEGNFVLSFGQRIFSAPTGIAVSGERVFVADRLQRKIHIFDVSGNSLGSLGGIDLHGPEGLTFYSPGHLLVADSDRVVDVDVDKETAIERSDVGSQAKRIVGIAIDANGNYIVTDFDRNRVFFLSEMSELYTGYFVKVEKVEAAGFPEIIVDISVTDRRGNPVFGLKNENFRLTEFKNAVQNPELLRSNTTPSQNSIVILVERSLESQRVVRDIGDAAAKIYDLFENDSQIRIVSAGEDPVVDTDFGDTRLRLVDAAKRGRFSSSWKLDRGIAMAAAQLFPTRGKRSVIFLSTGGLGRTPYGDESLMELVQLLRNNSISFNAVYLSDRNMHPDIQFICEATGGRGIYLYNPKGMAWIKERLDEFRHSTYVLKYQSSSDSQFGRRYIQLEAEITLQSKSGYDESGYFAPLQF
jgi:DNA-binding beta-propeller fold protein YncE